MLRLPKHIEAICERLEGAEFAAYAVGGCVRDLLLGKVPHDYDVTTAARPEAVKRLFPHTVDTGFSHGTVTIVLPEGNVEVTTFRQDGVYTDKRRPDSVTFLSEIDGDLSRRDFTVNAMAFSPTRGFCDPFSGREDLKRKILRTVGVPCVRFGEDALRILRLFRFAAKLRFSIEEETAAAAREMKDALSLVSRERIFSEVEKLLLYADVFALQNAASVLSAVLPQADLSPRSLQRAADCPAAAGKWAHLCGEKTEETLRNLRAPRALILSAGELASYRRGRYIVEDAAALRHTALKDFFAFLNDAEAEEEWHTAKKNGVPMEFGQLKITGKEIKEIGFCGREIGAVLQRLFVYAIENPANNKEEILREVATWIYKQESSQKA